VGVGAIERRFVTAFADEILAIDVNPFGTGRQKPAHLVKLRIHRQAASGEQLGLGRLLGWIADGRKRIPRRSITRERRELLHGLLPRLRHVQSPQCR
jgi:hypothetical protein